MRDGRRLRADTDAVTEFADLAFVAPWREHRRGRFLDEPRHDDRLHRHRRKHRQRLPGNDALESDRRAVIDRIWRDAAGDTGGSRRVSFGNSAADQRERRDATRHGHAVGNTSNACDAGLNRHGRIVRCGRHDSDGDDWNGNWRQRRGKPTW